MKIAIVSTLEAVPWTGCEELWAAMAKHALAAGHQVVCSVRRWPDEPPKIRALRNLGAAILPRRGRVPSADKLLARLRRQPVRLPRPHLLSPASRFRNLFTARPDVVLFSQAWAYDFLYNKDLVAWLKSSRVPYVVVNQLNLDFQPPNRNQINRSREFFGRAFKVAFVSQANLLAAERQLAARLTNAYVAMNPTNLTDHSQVPWPDDFAEPHLACVGRLESGHKGQDILLEALAAPEWRERKWRLRFYGAGPDKDYLVDLAAHYRLSDRVTFEGHISDIRKLWEKNQLLVLASRIEGTPLALVEAMFCGRPAVVTDAGGNAEWIEDGQSGFVSPGTTAQSFRAALERAWEVRATWSEMGRKAHAAAEKRYAVSPGTHLLEVILAGARTR